MSRAMPYSPMGHAVCTTTHDEMQAKLTRRVQEIAAKSLKPGETADLETGEIIHVEQHTAQPLPERGPDAVAELVGVDPPARVLSWCKPERGATGVRTTCGRFSCAKITLDGQLVYELWRINPGTTCFKLIATRLDSFAKAQDLAEEQLRGKP